eukprot:scaffold36803_cov45-Cyclotella_meneghiniana.AAC.3
MTANFLACCIRSNFLVEKFSQTFQCPKFLSANFNLKSHARVFEDQTLIVFFQIQAPLHMITRIAQSLHEMKIAFDEEKTGEVTEV